MNTYVADSDDEVDGSTTKSVNLFQSYAYVSSGPVTTVPKTIKKAGSGSPKTSPGPGSGPGPGPSETK